MAGNPGETTATLRNNLSLAKSYLPDTVQFFPLMPYPGTASYTWAKTNGYLKIRSYRDYLTARGLHNCVIDLPGLPAEEIVKWCDKSRREYYLNPRYLAYKLKQTITNPHNALRTYKDFVTFRKYLTRRKT